MKNAVRLCILAETFPPVPGGAEVHARMLASGLNSIGMETFVLTRRCYPDSPKTESVDGTPTFRLPPVASGRWGKFLMAPFAFFELMCRRQDYDVVYVCALRVLGVPAVAACRLLGKVCVLRAETNGELSGDYAAAYGRLPLLERAVFKGWLGLRNLFIKRSNAFVGITELAASEFKECGISPEKVFIIPNGIDTSRFYPAEREERLYLRQNLGLPSDKTIVVNTCRLVKGKGVEYLLLAWERVAAERGDAHLVIVGSGGGEPASCEDELKEFVRERGLSASVTFTGWRDDVAGYLRASDLFVFPTEYEGFGLSLVEAMACGLPVITSGVGGILSIVTDGMDGILVEPKDPAALFNEIMRVLGNPELAGHLGRMAARTALERYSMKSVAAQHFELFTDLYESR
jgi:glycosyltransferase involved in cell wall biosynthesis